MPAAARRSARRVARRNAPGATGCREAEAASTPARISERSFSVASCWSSYGAWRGGERRRRLQRAIQRRQRLVVLAVRQIALVAQARERLGRDRSRQHRVSGRRALPRGCSPSRTSCAGCGRPGRRGGPPRREAHGARHRHGILRAGNRGVHQHGVRPQLHRERRVGGGADAGVDDHGHLGELADDPEVVRVLDAEARADRRAERHHGRGACVFELAAHDRIVGRVGQHDEAFLHQRRGGFEQRLVVGEERPLVADDLELDPVGHARPRAPAAQCGRPRRPCSSRPCSAATDTARCRCNPASTRASDRRC